MKMKKFLFLVLIVVTFINCKAYMQKQRCLKLVENNEVIDVKNYKELIIYIGYENEKTIEMWLIDGEFKTKDEFIKIINANRYNFYSIIATMDLSAKLLHPSKEKTMLIVLTDQCLTN